MNALHRWSLTLLPLAWLAAGSAGAGTIYKCTGRGVAVTYQSMPCGSDDAERRVARFAGPSDVALPPPLPVDAATVPRAKGGPWPRRPIALGMTDDEVLNMPAWGRPGRIVRSRLARGWQEVWSYPDAWGAERQLVFSNARLADIVDVPRARLAQRTD
jgi:hypothetical protein